MAPDPKPPAAYGGTGWSPREASLREEAGTVWGSFGVSSEWGRLRAVLLHRPGGELEDVGDPERALMLAAPDPVRARREHDRLAEAYRARGVRVVYVDPPRLPPPNLMYVADLLFMTPEGAIVGRPASTVRAGEERWVARRLADLGVPILRSVRGRGTFEGADAMWLDPGTVLLARGLRTNREGWGQVAGTLRELGADVVSTALPAGTMHLMGQLRIVDRDLALAWPGRLPDGTRKALEERGLTVLFPPDPEELARGMALNVVVLGPREILMPEGNPRSRSFYEGLGIRCREVPASELAKGAGGIGCLTGVLEREPGDAPGEPGAGSGARDPSDPPDP